MADQDNDATNGPDCTNFETADVMNGGEDEPLTSQYGTSIKTWVGMILFPSVGKGEFY